MALYAAVEQDVLQARGSDAMKTARQEPTQDGEERHAHHQKPRSTK